MANSFVVIKDNLELHSTDDPNDLAEIVMTRKTPLVSGEEKIVIASFSQKEDGEYALQTHYDLTNDVDLDIIAFQKLIEILLVLTEEFLMEDDEYLVDEEEENDEEDNENEGEDYDAEPDDIYDEEEDA